MDARADTSGSFYDDLYRLVAGRDDMVALSMNFTSLSGILAMCPHILLSLAHASIAWQVLHSLCCTSPRMWRRRSRPDASAYCCPLGSTHENCFLWRGMAGFFSALSIHAFTLTCNKSLLDFLQRLLYPVPAEHIWAESVLSGVDLWIVAMVNPDGKRMYVSCYNYFFL